VKYVPEKKHKDQKRMFMDPFPGISITIVFSDFGFFLPCLQQYMAHLLSHGQLDGSG
jgi:hypothetical protein